MAEQTTRRVRIVSNGTYMGTKVTDADTGEVIPRVRSVVVRVMSPEDPVQADVVCLLPAVDLVAEARITHRGLACDGCAEAMVRLEEALNHLRRIHPARTSPPTSP